MAWGIVLIIVGGLVTVFTLWGIPVAIVGLCVGAAGLDVLA